MIQTSSSVARRWMQDLLTAPTVHALSLEDAKSHLKVEWDHDDVEIEAALWAAENYISDRTGIALAPQQRLMKIPSFPSACLELIFPPFTSATINILDSDNAPQPWTEFHVITSQKVPAQLYPDTDWPDVGSTRADAIQITIDCGYTICPEDLQRAIRAKLEMIYYRDPDREELLNSMLNSLLATNHKGSYDAY